jgi:hypothetical protein
LALSKFATSVQSGTIPFLVLLTTNATAREAISLSSTKLFKPLPENKGFESDKFEKPRKSST